MIWPEILSPANPEEIWAAPAGWSEPAAALAALLTGEPPPELADLAPAAAAAHALALAAAYTEPGERAWLLTGIAGNLLPAGLSDLARRLLDLAWDAACAMPAGQERLLALARIFDTENWIYLVGRINQALDLARGEPAVALLINACAPQLDRLAVSSNTWAQLDFVSRVALR